jgi:hypothetical protein
LLKLYNIHADDWTQEQIFGPYILDLVSPDGKTIQTARTTATYHPSKDCVDSGDCPILGGTTVSISGIFQYDKVPAATYKICVEGTDYCKGGIEKLPNFPKENVLLQITGDDIVNGEGGGAAQDSDPCAIPDGALRWIACPVSTAMQTFTNYLSGVIQGLLTTPTGSIFNENFKQAWNVFRAIGVALVVIAGLVMVISQAAGLEIFDAYTVRKVLPRLLLVAIGMSLSWPLLQFVVTLFNDLGNWAHDLILTPFQASQEHFSSIAAVMNYLILGVGGAAAAISLFLLGVFGVLSLVGTLLLAALIGVIILSIRQLIILVGVLVAPLAIAAYILPGTQKLWTLWKDSMIGALAMFPIIMAILAAGQAMAWVADSTPGKFNHILAVFIYFAGWLGIVFGARAAGGIMGALTQIANDRSKGGFDRLRNIRKNQSKKRKEAVKHRIESGNFFRRPPKDSRRERVNRRLQTASIVGKGDAGFRPSEWRNNIEFARGKYDVQHVAHAEENSAAFSAIKGNDDMLEAIMAGRMDLGAARAHLIKKGFQGEQLDRMVQGVRQVQKDLGQETAAQAAATYNAGTSTSYENGPGEMLDDLLKASGDDFTVFANLLAQARGKAEQGRRYDLLMGGFNDSFKRARRIASAPVEVSEEDRARGVLSRAEVVAQENELGADMSLETQGAGAVLAGKGQSGRNMASAMQRRIQKSTAALDAIQQYEAGDRSAETLSAIPQVAQIDEQGHVKRDESGQDLKRYMNRQEIEREWIQNMASTSATIDNAGSAAPEIGRLLADTVHNGRISMKNLTPYILNSLAVSGGTADLPSDMLVSDVMERLEHTPEVAQMKRVFQRQQLAQQQDMAQRSAAMSLQGQAAVGVQPPGGQFPLGPSL